MRMAPLLTASLLCISIANAATGATWDEPWHEQVVRNSDTFIKARVTACEPRKLTLKTLKQVAGADVPDTLVVDEFSMLHLGSVLGGHDDELDFKLAVGEDWYFFLKRVKGRESWALPTPSAGRAGVSKGKVYATYRHSYHQAVVPEDVYVPTMTAIFEYLHGRNYDETYIHNLFEKYLSQPPQGPPDEKDRDKELAMFFNQHVALECFYYFGTTKELDLLGPFLASDAYHVRISAVRALSRIDTTQTRQRLWGIAVADGDGFARIMALWGLKRLDAREYLPKLREFAKTAPEDQTGFGGKISDPRVGTRFPASVRDACNELVGQWTGAETRPSKK